VIDPMTYIAKGAGAGLSKIGDISKALKGVGAIEIPKLPDNAITLPEGALKLPDGTVHLPEGSVIPPGAVELPDGTFQLPHDGPVLPEGSMKLPTEHGAPAQYMDPHGNILDEHGDVLHRADDGPGDIVDQPDLGDPHAGSDVPHTPSPVKEPALVGAGTHTAEQAGQHIRLGDNAGHDLGDVGRTGDHAAVHAGNDIPTVHAGGENIPTTHTTDHLPAGHTGDNLPGGHAPDNLPANSLDTHTPAHTSDHATPTTAHDHLPGGHGHEPGTGGTGHDLPGGGTDTLPGHTPEVPGGGPHEPPSPHGAHPGADDAAHRAEYESAREKPAAERTPAERAAITHEHVRLANEDPAWRAEHYDKWGPGKRNNAEELVDGQLLPKLVEKPGGGWMAAHDLPYANPEKFRLDPLERGRDTVAPHDLHHLDDVSAKRVAGMDLANAERAYHANPTDEAAHALAQAQEHFDHTVGEGVSNNSKLGEALGEESARRHMLLQQEFDGAHEITDLPETPNGSKRFDQLWRDKDGHLVIVEAKGPNARLDWRQGNGAQDSGTMVKQGTIEYVRTILADMDERAAFSPNDAKYAKEIRTAIKNKTLQYVLVQATENTGNYAGAELRHFKIF
ncbi:hypothetical protein ABZ870_29515, partial [Streptomyces sp. NPDC046978]